MEIYTIYHNSSKNYLSYLFKIICMSGFIYQTKLLVNEYFSGNTIVSVKIGREKLEHLPAITICIPFSVSLEKAAGYNSDNEKSFEEYKGLLKTFNAGNNFQTEPDSETRKSLLSIYSKMAIPILNSSMSAYDYFNNYTYTNV